MKKTIYCLIMIALLLSSCSSEVNNTSATQINNEESTTITTNIAITTNDEKANALGSRIEETTDREETTTEEIAYIEGAQSGNETNINPKIQPLVGTLPSGIDYNDLLQEIDALVENNKNKMAGMSVSVFTAEDVILEKSYGYANIEDSILCDLETVYNWGSVSKTLVWISVMQLVEQGKIDLEVDIRTYLPEKFFSKLMFNDPITMLQLMNHTAGWARIAHNYIMVDGDYIKGGNLAEEIKKAEPSQLNQPGQRLEDSDYSPAVAAYIVECIAGIPYYEYVHRNIFIPLNILQTALKPDLSDNEWVKIQRGKLICYSDPSISAEIYSLGTAEYQDTLYPSGMTTGTIPDMRKFGQALLEGDRKISPLFEREQTLSQLHTPTYYDTKPTGEKVAWYSHGFYTGFALRTKDAIGFTGNSPGCTTFLLVDKDSGVGVVMAVNQKNDVYFSSNISKVVFGIKTNEATNPDGDNAGHAEMTEHGIHITWIPENETAEYLIFSSTRGDLGSQINEKPVVGGEYIDETLETDVSIYYTIVKVGSDPSKGIKIVFQK